MKCLFGIWRLFFINQTKLSAETLMSLWEWKLCLLLSGSHSEEGKCQNWLHRSAERTGAEETARAHVQTYSSVHSHHCPFSPVLSFGGQSEIVASVPGHMNEGAWLGSLWGICSGRNPLHSRPLRRGQGGGLQEKSAGLQPEQGHHKDKLLQLDFCILTVSSSSCARSLDYLVTELFCLTHLAPRPADTIGAFVHTLLYDWWLLVLGSCMHPDWSEALMLPLQVSRLTLHSVRKVLTSVHTVHFTSIFTVITALTSACCIQQLSIHAAARLSLCNPDLYVIWFLLYPAVTLCTFTLLVTLLAKCTEEVTGPDEI